MDDLAMKYEHLIGNAFNCGRYGMPGVDADIYRGLCSRYVHRDKDMNAYLLSLGEVIAYLKFACFMYNEAYADNEDFCKELKEFEEYLAFNPSMDNVDNFILQVEQLLLTIKISL